MICSFGGNMWYTFLPLHFFIYHIYGVLLDPRLVEPRNCYGLLGESSFSGPLGKDLAFWVPWTFGVIYIYRRICSMYKNEFNNTYFSPCMFGDACWSSVHYPNGSHDPIQFLQCLCHHLGCQESPLGKCYLAADPIAPLRDWCLYLGR